jgi:hypothetical protein
MAAEAAGFSGRGVGAQAPFADRPAAGVAGADPGCLPAPAASLRQVVRLRAGDADALPVWPVARRNRSRPQSAQRGWAARTGPGGELIPLAEQDRALWGRGLITEGVALVVEAMSQGMPAAGCQRGRP